MRKLSYKNLPYFNDDVAVPKYTQGDIKPAIVHFGVGNFHRSHMQWYLNQLFNQGKAHNWGIIGTGVTEHDIKTHHILKQQDYLTTLVCQSPDSLDVSILGGMVDFISPNDGTAIIRRLTNPDICIVSLTVTEGGYFLDANDNFDTTHPHIQHDIENPDTPKTVFGFIVKALEKRWQNSIPPFTVMSCDNLPHNGNIIRNVVMQLAGFLDQRLENWIAENVAFPNSMVDCITCATGAREKDFVKNQYGIMDEKPVFCEHFHQWVLEDSFSMGRPPLETVGVKLVDDVSDYEKMKIRILNGGHAVLAYPSALLDINFVHDAINHTCIRDFIRKVEKEEICPLVPSIVDMSPDKYYTIVENRLLNDKIADTSRRLCFDGSNRQPKFIVPSIAERLEQNQSIAGLALSSAMWCRYCYGITETEQVIEPNDPNWAYLQHQSQLAKNNPAVWLRMHHIYGKWGQSQTLKDTFSMWLDMIWQQGVEKTLQQYILEHY